MLFMWMDRTRRSRGEGRARATWMVGAVATLFVKTRGSGGLAGRLGSRADGYGLPCRANKQDGNRGRNGRFSHMISLG